MLNVVSIKSKGENTLSRERKPPPVQIPAIERRKARKQIHIHDDLDYYVIRSNIQCDPHP